MRTFSIMLLLLAMGAAGWYLGRSTARQQLQSASSTQTPEPVSPSGNIHGIGKLEPKSGVISVFAPAGQQVHSVGDLKIGDRVKRDQPLFVLSGRDQRALDLMLAKAKRADAIDQLNYEKSKGRLQQQASQLALLEADSAKQKIDSQRKGIELLKTQRDAAEKQLNRLKSLRADTRTRRLVGETDIEKQQLLVGQLKTQISQAGDEVAIATEQADRAREAAEINLRTVKFVINESESSVPLKSLDGTIAAAEAAWEMTEIKSPIDGVVLDIVVQPGDTATNQPVMLLGDTDEMVCVAEINDARLHEVSQGDSAVIRSLSLEEPLQGTVISRGVMISPPSMKDPNPFGSVDRRTGQVVIQLDTNPVARNFVNLPVEVEILKGKTPKTGAPPDPADDQRTP